MTVTIAKSTTGIVMTTMDAGNKKFNSRLYRIRSRFAVMAGSGAGVCPLCGPYLINSIRRWRFMWSWAVFIWLLMIFPSITASAKNSITWLEVNMPPYLIQEGPGKSEGYGNIVSSILQEHLPEYEHHTVVTNVIRHFDRFRKGEQVCSIGLYKTPEREAFMYFSIPSMLTMPAVLITTKEKQAEFRANESIKLEDVLKNTRFILGLSKDRSYGTTIDLILDKYQNRKNLVLYSGQELTANYFKMLMLNRLDGLVGLPDEAMYHAEKLGLRDRLATLIIEENQQDYSGWFCAVGCAKNAWGQGVIDRINQVLIEQRPTARYRAAYERWLDPAHLERYRTVYKEVFLQTVPPHN